MAYNELIKHYEKIRDYMREFFIYGFRHRGDVGSNDERTYDNKRRQIESWLAGYMAYERSSSGKAQIISVDSREVICNPLYKAFKASSFTKNDILLHFCILDMLIESEGMSIPDIIHRLYSDYLNKMDSEVYIGERTIKNKVEEYEKIGILEMAINVDGMKYYSFWENKIDLRSWFDTISFYSEINTLGVIGSFLLDKKEFEGYESSLWFKHHYMLYAMDSEIVEKALEAIRAKKQLEITTKNNTFEVCPIKLYVSTQNGREYLLCHETDGSGIMFVRLDNIRYASVKGKCKNYQEYVNEYEASKPYLWGVREGNAKDIAHIEMTIMVSKDENFIINRLEREKRNGHVYKLSENRYKYVVDTYDAMELMPWIRTFIGRIEKLESSNSCLKEKFDEDMKQLCSMYLGGDDSDI